MGFRLDPIYNARVSIESTVYVRGQGWVSRSFEETRTASHEAGSLAWISLVDPGEGDFDVISENVSLEPRLLEEAALFPHRSGVERHETGLVAVLPILRDLDEGIGDGAAGEGGVGSVRCEWLLVLAVEAPNMIVTLTDGEDGVVGELRRRLEGRSDLPTRGSETILLEMIGEVVGDYERAVEAIEGAIREIEATVMEGRSREVLRRIHVLSGQAVGMQQAMKPLATALEQLAGGDAPVSHRQLSRTKHRALRVTEKLDSARDLLSSLLQVNLTVVGQKISAWGAILIVPSLIAGVFGMNFDNAWLKAADHGFEIMIAIMLLVSGSLYVWFKRSGWL